ncbi:MAG: NADH-quinone oxidoreductase subunit K [Spirochaetales bacterium]|nr:NADH-quinone oxidoreductase subunit K [Spirochaetales bacterium]
MVFPLCFALFVVGLYCVLAKRNTVKIVIGLAVMEYATNLFFILLGYRKQPRLADVQAPIRVSVANLDDFFFKAVDPLPQALVLTSIVIGVGVTALALALCIRLYQRYGTFDIDEMRRLKG